MKVLSVIVSLLGNTITIVCGLLGSVFGLLYNLRPYLIHALSRDVIPEILPVETENIFVIVFIGAAVVGLIIASIGNKIEDKFIVNGPLMKIKRGIFGFLRFVIGNVVIIILYGFISLAMVWVSISNIIDAHYYEAIIGLVAYILGYAISIGLLQPYCLKHCKYCGGSFSGADYQYNEEERGFSVDNSGNGNLTSKIRFEFVCPHCSLSTVYRKKMKTDAAAVEKYARGVTK